MKSYNHLFEKMLDRDFILKCIKKASKGKRRRRIVREVLGHPDEHVTKIQELLTAGTFLPRKHTPKVIVERGKERKIVKPDFCYEAIIQCMIVECLEPVFMRMFYTNSFASIPGRGITKGRKAVIRHIRKTKGRYGLWCLKIDIRKFFESIDICILKEKLLELIRDKEFLKLCFVVLDSSPVKGLPLGFVTSQWFANFYLTSFDHEISALSGRFPYDRYMDDIIALFDNPIRPHAILNEMRWRMKRLGLEIKSNWQIFKVSGKTGRPIDYMGFKFYTNRVTLRKSTLCKTCRKVLRMHRKGKMTVYDARQLISRLGWMKQAQTYGYYKHRIAPYISMKELRKIVRKGGNTHGILQVAVNS